VRCAVDGCPADAHARGVCAPHYSRWHRLVAGQTDPPGPSEVLDRLDGVPSGTYPYGARTVTGQGYVLVKVGRLHPAANVRGWAYEHRLVAAERLGRPLADGETVVHRNGVQDDNRPENLDVVARAVTRT
jgi:hypothetical protein